MAETGILLLNLGSPDAPTTRAVRRYLDQFLSDPRVVEMPRVLWQVILKLFILPRYPAKSAALYAQIWKDGDNPLRLITQAQVEALQARFPDVALRYALRYGKPSVAGELEAFRAAGVKRLLLAPLYPQYASATTGTALAEAFRVLAGWREVPAVHTLPPYYAAPSYIAALAASVRQALSGLSFVPEKILLSFHGLPESAIARGDPYARHCEETASLLRTALGRDAGEMPLAYQSRFGRARWLGPCTVGLLEKLAGEGVRNLLVLCPGFAADCIETTDEIGRRARDSFRAAGGRELALVPCLNASPGGMDMLAGLLTHALAGWPQLP